MGAGAGTGGNVDALMFYNGSTAPSLESLMADINTTLETLTARIDQLVADLKATNPTPAAAPPARTRWTFETEVRSPKRHERYVLGGQIGQATSDWIGAAPVIVPSTITPVDP